MAIVRNAIYEFEMPMEQRQNAFLSAYNLDLRVQGVCIRVGRFSIGALHTIKFLPHPNDQSVLEIGSFCEFSYNSRIIVGGNHRNDRLFNFTFSSGPIFKQLMEDEARRQCDVAPTIKTMIGDNVLLSDGAIVVSGAQIGRGSVIAAGAVVSGSIGSLGIYGGIPARRIRDRFEPATASLYEEASFSDIAAHSLTELPLAMARLEKGQINLAQFRSELDFLDKRPVIEASLSRRPNSDRGIQVGAITGYRVDDTPVADDLSIRKLNEYFSQIHLDQPKVRWIPDVFDALDLYGGDL